MRVGTKGLFHPCLKGENRSPQTILGERHAINCIDLSTFLGSLCSAYSYAWYVPAKADVTVITGMHILSDATIFVGFENARIKYRYTRTPLNARLFDSLCRPEIFLPREMKAEADLSLVRD